MKKSVLLFLILIACFKSNAQTPNESKTLGLVAYLTAIKCLGEGKMISLIKDSAQTKANIAAYGILQYRVNVLINQLSADLVFYNKLNCYRKLNNYVKGKKASLPKKYSSYIDIIKAIDASYQLLLEDTAPKSMLVFADIDLLGAVELGHTIITDARDARATKIESLITIIAENKLNSIDSLVKKE